MEYTVTVFEREGEVQVCLSACGLSVSIDLDEAAVRLLHERLGSAILRMPFSAPEHTS